MRVKGGRCVRRTRSPNAGGNGSSLIRIRTYTSGLPRVICLSLDRTRVAMSRRNILGLDQGIGDGRSMGTLTLLSLPGLSRQPMEVQAQLPRVSLGLNLLSEVCTRVAMGRRNKSGDDRDGGWRWQEDRVILSPFVIAGLVPATDGKCKLNCQVSLGPNLFGKVCTRVAMSRRNKSGDDRVEDGDGGRESALLAFQSIVRGELCA
jgi:hypothetical protein